MPNVKLAPGETTEVDLTPLLQAVRNRHDLDVVSVQVSNSGESGTLIGSLYGINNTTGVNYDTPLRDSGPVRTMTGSYPWKVTKDYTTIVYITNITDEQAEFAGEINYSGGHFLIDARKLAPGETAVLDLRAIRDKQEGNREGHKVSKDFSQGQLKWAVRGDTKGKIVLIGRAEMVSRSQNISTSYSCNDPCPPSYDGWLSPFPPPIVIVNATEEAGAWEQMSYDWGYTVGPYAVAAAWSLDNAVGTLTPEAAHLTTFEATTPGEAILNGHIGTQTDYGWDGRDCYYNGTYEEGGEGPVKVVPVRYTRVTQDYGNANFSEFLGSYSATLSLPSNSPPCTGHGFDMHVYLEKGLGATLYGPLNPGNFADTADDSQYRVGGGLENETTSTPDFFLHLQRINPNNPNRPIRIGVAGYTDTKSFSVPANVTITCD